MLNIGTGFTKCRWFCTAFGLIVYVIDIGSDVVLAVDYFKGGHFTWCMLTLLFVFSGSICTQIFSYIWFRDDMANGMISNKRQKISDRILLDGLHVLQMGIFTRYYQLMKKSAKTIWSKHSNENDVKHKEKVQLDLFALATDLSMLRLFETFLESVPQLLLQLYILLGHNHRSIKQYICMVGSFLNIAWATVDYRRCLRRSLPHITEMPLGLPTAVYLLYKLLTITTRVLSLSLFIVLNAFNTLALALIWLLGTVWAHALETDFCTSLGLELLYRAIVGVILTFTFFNVKGKNTKVPMTVYYIFYALQNLSAPVLLFLFKPEAEIMEYFLPITLLIIMGTALGLGLLGLYYTLLHPRGIVPCSVADEVDGTERLEPENTSRIRHFLQI